VGRLGVKSTFFTVYQIIVILHAYELVPAVLFGNVLEGLELPGRHLCHNHQSSRTV
jgi:hypothetical protein